MAQDSTATPTNRAIFPPDDAECFFKACAGQPYRPSNGSEGELFEAAWCNDCRRDAAFRADMESGVAGCSILFRVHAHDIGGPGYPKEWIYGQDGQPCCTAFRDKHAPHPAYRCKRTADLFGEGGAGDVVQAERGRASA